MLRQCQSIQKTQELFLPPNSNIYFMNCIYRQSYNTNGKLSINISWNQFKLKWKATNVSRLSIFIMNLTDLIFQHFKSKLLVHTFTACKLSKNNSLIYAKESILTWMDSRFGLLFAISEKTAGTLSISASSDSSFMYSLSMEIIFNGFIVEWLCISFNISDFVGSFFAPDKNFNAYRTYINQKTIPTVINNLWILNATDVIRFQYLTLVLPENQILV